MIPTLLVPGLLIGRWWLVPVAGVAWPVLLVAGGIETGSVWRFFVGAGALAAANVAVAVGLHRVTVRLARRLAGLIPNRYRAENRP